NDRIYQSRTIHITHFTSHTPSTRRPTLSLHDALPIFLANGARFLAASAKEGTSEWTVRLGKKDVRTLPLEDVASVREIEPAATGDRKSTRLNSSHVKISYAVFCLKKKRIYDLIY